jgi:signal peptidase
MKTNVSKLTKVYLWFYFPIINILKIIVTIFLVVVITFIATIGLENSIMSNWGYRTYVILSESMVPKFNMGDLIIVKNSDEYIVGDVITYTLQLGDVDTITHRIVEKNKNTAGETIFKTKGDNNKEKDTWVARPDLIKGKVIFSIPILGNAINSIRTLEGVIFLLIIPSTALLTLQARDFYEDLKKKYLEISQDKE